ncbi:DUF805 domain-containing protein [Bradyrhizobium sp. GCM10027634]|uniref:DUF805 domain-containing protein n=1 Tax=unclassified Bradyrhizobium TaxID=2631580 RepID=UPI00188A9622|nr:MULTISPECIES: DUF805 domain-containing protein [unclassified Bradyrhizobium]MDN5001819.1 DUF805 domain-containing protein [Bradyrhizobium sp. WYCCWR 12677]QOZ45872.1 DUF805 domain-containing protein [Bradyrhizobium sp. CCBAU 53340]
MDILRFLFSFRGRVGRFDYVLRFLIPLAVVHTAAIALVPPLQFGVVFGALVLLSLWPSWAVGAKRCHDRGRSGWFQLIVLIPIVGPLRLMIELVFLPGVKGQTAV